MKRRILKIVMKPRGDCQLQAPRIASSLEEAAEHPEPAMGIAPPYQLEAEFYRERCDILEGFICGHSELVKAWAEGWDPSRTTLRNHIETELYRWVEEVRTQLILEDLRQGKARFIGSPDLWIKILQMGAS